MECEGCTWCHTDFAYMCKKEPDKLIQFLKSHNVIKKEIFCSTCGKLATYNEETMMYRCQKTEKIAKGKKVTLRKCNFQASLKKGTWFENCNLTVQEACEFIAYYITLRPPRTEFLRNEMGFTDKTIVDWGNFIREALFFWCLESTPEKIGGPGKIVEIDEAKFGKRKYHRGRVIDGQWLFGGFERESRELFIVPVPDRSKDCLLSVIKDKIADGTTIMSDCWKSYDCLGDEGFQHFSVNHKSNFGDFKRKFPNHRDRYHMIFEVEIIHSILKRKDGIYLLSTGGGKSITYWLPTLIANKTSLIICPLISLINDQCRQLDLLNMTQDGCRNEELREECFIGNKRVNFIYVTPEKLLKDINFLRIMQQLYTNKKIFNIIIDEVHVLIDWGQSFRPYYMGLRRLKALFENVQINCFSATVLQEDILNIIKILRLVHCDLVIGDIIRKNIAYKVHYDLTTKVMNKKLLQYIKVQFINMSGIIYCKSRVDTYNMSTFLANNDIDSCIYHAELGDEEKLTNYEKWFNDECHVICATIALGMRIDKRNVRFIIHCSLPNSVNAYVQESGRVDRDGGQGQSILFYSVQQSLQRISTTITNPAPLKLKKHIIKKYLSLDKLLNYTNNCRCLSLKRFFTYSNQDVGEVNRLFMDCRQCDICLENFNNCVVNVDCLIEPIYTFLEIQMILTASDRREILGHTVECYKKKCFKTLRCLGSILSIDENGVNTYRLQRICNYRHLVEIMPVTVPDFVSHFSNIDRTYEIQNEDLQLLEVIRKYKRLIDSI